MLSFLGERIEKCVGPDVYTGGRGRQLVKAEFSEATEFVLDFFHFFYLVFILFFLFCRFLECHDMWCVDMLVWSGIMLLSVCMCV